MSAYDQAFTRVIERARVPFADFIGTTNATLNTQTLFTHGLRNHVGTAVAPTRVMVTASAATPAGFPYEVAANHTTTQCDIRATGASVAFRARAWL
jgi:hypothetical protein